MNISPKQKKLAMKVALVLAITAALYVAYRFWAISIIKSNMRKSMADVITQKATENNTDFETQLSDDAKWVFKKNGFEWYK